MIRNLSPIELGGSLYIPAIHKNVNDVCNADKYPQLRSCIIDTEDAIGEDDLAPALENIAKMLENYEPRRLRLFIRPRNPQILKQLLKIKHVEKIDGFSLPKFSTEVMREYAQILTLSEHRFYIMPVLESLDLFSREKLEEIAAYASSADSVHSKVAMLVGQDLSFGVSRMYEVYRQTGETEVMVFRDESKAMTWLHE